MLHLLKLILKATGKKGVPQGGVISPLLSNLYLNEVDKMLEKAKEVTRTGKWTHIEYARFADDLVILIDGHPRHGWLLKAVDTRLREEFAKLHVELNEEKSRTVDLTKGGEFWIPGFRFPAGPQPKGRMVCLQGTKAQEANGPATEAQGGLPSPSLSTSVASDCGDQSDPSRLGAILCHRQFEPLLQLCAVVGGKEGTSASDAGPRAPGFGWRRWSTPWFYGDLGLYGDYRIRYYQTLRKATPT